MQNVNVNANVKELIYEGICDKGFTWTPSNCKCECDKLCDVEELLKAGWWSW